MLDWKAILNNIYCPEPGTIWAAPNGIWNKTFAANKSATDLHPSVVERVSACTTITYIVPGTSKNYCKGSCVYKVRLRDDDTNTTVTHFLINLSMAFPKDDLKKLSRGWNDVDILSDAQIADFKLQIKFCKGLHV